MSAAFTDIPVDAIDRRYQQLATDGLLNLDGQNIPESETVKKVATPESDLTLATQSDKRVKAPQPCSSSTSNREFQISR